MGPSPTRREGDEVSHALFYEVAGKYENAFSFTSIHFSSRVHREWLLLVLKAFDLFLSSGL